MQTGLGFVLLLLLAVAGSSQWDEELAALPSDKLPQAAAAVANNPKTLPPNAPISFNPLTTAHTNDNNDSNQNEHDDDNNSDNNDSDNNSDITTPIDTDAAKSAATKPYRSIRDIEEMEMAWPDEVSASPSPSWNTHSTNAPQMGTFSQFHSDRDSNRMDTTTTTTPNSQGKLDESITTSNAKSTDLQQGEAMAQQDVTSRMVDYTPDEKDEVIKMQTHRISELEGKLQHQEQPSWLNITHLGGLLTRLEAAERDFRERERNIQRLHELETALNVTQTALHDLVARQGAQGITQLILTSEADVSVNDTSIHDIINARSGVESAKAHIDKLTSRVMEAIQSINTTNSTTELLQTTAMRFQRAKKVEEESIIHRLLKRFALVSDDEGETASNNQDDDENDAQTQTQTQAPDAENEQTIQPATGKVDMTSEMNADDAKPREEHMYTAEITATPRPAASPQFFDISMTRESDDSGKHDGHSNGMMSAEASRVQENEDVSRSEQQTGENPTPSHSPQFVSTQNETISQPQQTPQQQATNAQSAAFVQQLSELSHTTLTHLSDMENLLAQHTHDAQTTLEQLNDLMRELGGRRPSHLSDDAEPESASDGAQTGGVVDRLVSETVTAAVNAAEKAVGRALDDHIRRLNATVMQRILGFSDLMVSLNGSRVMVGDVLDKLWRVESSEARSMVLQEAALALQAELNWTRTNLSAVSLSHADLARERQLATDYLTGKVNYETGRVESKDGAVLEDSDSNILQLLKPTDPAMLHENIRLIVDVDCMVLVGLFAALFVARYRMPMLIGYVIAGMVIGPSGFNLVEELTEVETLSQMGVCFLLFELGVEFRFSDLKRVGTTAIAGGSLQLCGTAAVCAAVCVACNIVPLWRDGMFVGACVALSSTAVVAKLLVERKQMETEHGKVMLALLIAQDLGIGLILSLLPAFQDQPSSLPPASDTMSDSTGFDVNDIADEVIFHRKRSRMHMDSPFLFIILLTATKLLCLGVVAVFWCLFVMPKIYSILRAHNSHEIYLFGVLGYCLGVALVTDHLGLGLELGAFVAGLTIVEPQEVEQTMHVMASLRNVFGGMFFVSIGLLMSPKFVLNNLPVIVMFSVGIMLLKCLVCAPIVRLVGYSWRTGILVGAGISQVGEFAFLVASKGQSLGFMTRFLYLKLISSTVLTLILTPLFMSIASRIAHDPKGTYRTVTEHADADVEDLQAVDEESGLVGGIGDNKARAAAVPKPLKHPKQHHRHTSGSDNENSSSSGNGGSRGTAKHVSLHPGLHHHSKQHAGSSGSGTSTQLATSSTTTVTTARQQQQRLPVHTMQTLEEDDDGFLNVQDRLL